MKTKILIFALLLVTSFFLSTTPASADEKASGSSATLGDVMSSLKPDVRVMALQSFLKSHDSPMAPYADVFIREADKNNIPWYMVAAIAGTESTWGKFEPSSTCYNGWGYGIYGNNTLCFPSYDIAITTISKDLREKYIDKWNCKTIYDIGHYYASSPLWGDHTYAIMQDIVNYKLAYEAKTLPISL